MRRKIFSMLVLCFALTMLLGGCGSKSKDTVGNAGNNGSSTDAEELTKARWIGMLGDRFGYTEAFEDGDYYSDVKSDNAYYGQIQACAEWEVTEKADAFHPDNTADWKYVIETAVRAVGLDNINTSTAGVTVTEDSLVDFYTTNVANIGVSDLSVVPSVDDASQALDYAYQYYMDLTPADVYEMSYNESVYEVSAEAVSLKGDGFTAIINDGASYKAGDVIYVQPSETAGAYALKVTSCDGNQLKYELAGMEDVFEEMSIRGSFDAIIIDAEAADYVSLGIPKEDIRTSYPVNCPTSAIYSNLTPYRATDTGVDVKANGNGVFFHANIDGVDFTVSLTDFKTDVDVDFGIFSGLKKANATVSFKDKIEVNYQLEHLSKTIPLGKTTIQLGSTPFQLELSLVANIGMDGEITLTYTSTVVGKVEYSKGKGLVASVDNNNPAFDFHAEVTITAEPTVKVDLQCLSRSIVNFKVTSGVVAIATVDVDLLGNLPACIDVYLYVPLRWAVNEDGCVMTAISNKLKKSQTVWDSTNSKITKRFHWEDLVLVEKCTRGDEKAVETPTVAEDGSPYEEYNIFEFEELVFGYIEVVSPSIILDNGETMTIGILSVPSGYSSNDLVYTPEDTSVCSVSGGKITGSASGGSTVLKISTPDGKYSVYVTVIVAEEYNDTSGFQPL